MSVLVVGLSHRTAPLEVLERAALGAVAAQQLATQLCAVEYVQEAVCLATCNRLELYADVTRFHGGVGELGTALARATGLDLSQLTDHLYVHYESAAVEHLFTVTAGLDSMAVGETQILGQVRAALKAGQEGRSAGRVIGHLLQTALKVGKRAHSETALNRAAPSLVEAGLQRAQQHLAAARPEVASEPLPLRVLVLGAGAMSGLAVATAHRAGAHPIAVCSRTEQRAQRLAQSVDGVAVPLADLPTALAEADVVIAAAGADGYLVDAVQVKTAQTARHDRPQAYLDLALPRDIDPQAAQVPGVRVIDLEQLGQDLARHGHGHDVAAARHLVAQAVAEYLAEESALTVAPTVVALRAMARGIVEGELTRLEGRLGGVDPLVRRELEQTVHRVVEKLLHVPTVRIKELAAGPGGASYAEALRELFNLGPEPDDYVLSPRQAVGAPVEGRE